MTASEKTKIALVQMQCGTDPAANLAKAIARIRDAADQGGQIICLPELFRSQYFCQSEDYKYFALAEPIPGPSTTAFQKLARKYAVVLIASLFEKRAPGIYHNTAAIIDADGSLLGVYRKMHIPDDPLFNEKFYFTPGDATADDQIDRIGLVDRSRNGAAVASHGGRIDAARRLRPGQHFSVGQRARGSDRLPGASRYSQAD